jgi:hypothetical protein
MRAIEAVTDIPASPEAAWVVLTDFPAYPVWATYLQRIEGRAETGTWIRLVEGPPGRRPYKVRTRILEATAGTRLAWAARIPGAPWLPSAIFTGTHEFLLAALPSGGTRLTHREHFGGILSHLSSEGAVGADEGFAAFNEALKRRVLELAVGLSRPSASRQLGDLYSENSQSEDR